MRLRLSNLFIGIIIGIIIGSAYFLYNPQEVIKEKIEIKYKYATNTVYLDAPKIRSFILPEDTLVIPADTAELIARYKSLWINHNTRNFYQDTLKFDTLGYCVINTQVIKNNLDSLNGKFSLKIPEKTITKFVYPKNSLYIGGLVGKETVSPMIMYTNKGKYNYMVSYNLVRSEINAGVVIKIR